jgi:hypothetical protein
VTRVISAYPGYLTRLPDWKSTVIVRVPSDPLEPGRQIWLYYTHMADRSGNSFISEEFPAGTSEQFIEAGTFLGYQGDYSGDPNNPTGIHLHFSIVEDDGDGQFKNELEIENTLDPSPYLGLPLNAYENRDKIPLCQTAAEYTHLNHMNNELSKTKSYSSPAPAKGSGRALAEAFAERGAVVAANDISPINLEQVVEEITNKGGRAKAFVEDIAKKVGAQNLIKQVEDEFGRIDILINHASVRPRVPCWTWTNGTGTACWMST